MKRARPAAVPKINSTSTFSPIIRLVAITATFCLFVGILWRLSEQEAERRRPENVILIAIDMLRRGRAMMRPSTLLVV